uniref:Interferon-induced very large GTPase 1-like n=3 Tax=Podarcis muralis TaxID=64176 RepID=A0A670JIL1_PODMU|nr:interferon-induced very large GTPase 1-like isoform X1 [Podarcis muralis]
MAFSGRNPSEIIWRARRKLAEDLLLIDSELILDVADSHLLLTQGEFFSLSEIKDPQAFVECLIELVLGKRESTQELFLDCLENLRQAFPSLQPISEYVEDDHLNLRNDLQVSDSVEFSGERSGSKSMDLARSENQDASQSQEGVGEVETIGFPVSSEAGSGSQSPDDAVMLPGNASSTEDPDASLLLSSKEREVKTPDAPDVAENPSAAAMSTENRDRDEDLESSSSPWIGSGAESPSATLSSSKGSGASDGNCGKSEGTGSGVEIPGISASKREEEGAQQLDCSKRKRTSSSPTRRESSENSKGAFFQTSEDLASMQLMKSTSELTPAEKKSYSQKTKGSLMEDVPNETTIKGSMDSVMVSGGEIIRKARKQLIEILQKDLELVLDELFSQSLITEEEYEALDKTEEDSKKKIRKLLIMIQKMGEIACGKFLECLEIARPGSNQVLQNSVHERLPPEEKSPRVLGEREEAVPKGCSVGEEEGEIQKHQQEEKMDLGIGCPSQEKEDDVQEESEEENQHSTTERRKAVMGILCKLKLEKHKSKALSLQEVLKIRSGSLKEFTPQTREDLPWHFLRKILALNVTARSTSFEEVVSDGQVFRRNEGIDKDIFFTLEMGESHSVNPLDVLCAVLLCSDSFLQQEIFFKMSMCQFALPLLLPPLETPKCTLMLWAMRDIVKIWRPHSLAESRGFREESLVLTSMPTISFVRMGSLSFSKSKLLSEFLSPAQQHHDFFFHRDMECGDIPREIAGGLVEIAWYFPGGQKSSDLFPEPIAVANLRGDIESHWVQFSFLTQVSSAVFIFAEAIDERQHDLLSSLKGTSTQFYFILERDSNKCHEALGVLDKLAPIFNLCNSNILVQSAKRNKAEFVRKLRSTVRGILNSQPTCMSVQGMCAVTCELSIQADVDGQECQNALQCAEGITADIKDVARYKQEMLRLQGDLWKNLAKVEKELCRMKRQGDKPSEKYRSELKGKWLELRKQQSQCELTTGLMKFVDAISHLKSAEKHYFLKWMKFNLDHIARENLSKLRAEYKEKCKTSGDDVQKTAEIDRLISSSSLGVEHFMRELGQFYEAEYSMVIEGKIAKHRRQFVHFPSIAADLMLEGFPLELMDGDASNIPLQWITDVLTELHKKLRGRSKIKVITVLGVQSTGKSTLLNTMFGLQFAVSSGRCTRGAFMTLLNISENLAQDLGCDFVLVIDTEGLKAPELAKLEDSYQHDNELATLVIGLSDITIVNLAMENATEMKDILQIVTHAFLRMEEIGQSPSCQFVHQNVSDVSAYDQNMRDRKHLLEQLNEMTQAAAKMENIGRDIKFSDIMEYNPETNNWYIPGLWHGVPPMAPVNRGYSEKVFDLKKCLFKFIRDHARDRPSKNILDFIEWVKSLWNAVKHENFIFSFQNSLIAEAYNNLSIKYSEWDRDFRREMHLWVSEQETLIQNVSPDKIAFNNLKCELQKKLSCGEEQILESLNKYFGSEAANLHLVEKYKEDFVRSANSLKRELENYSSNKLRDAIQIRKGLYKIDALQAEYKKAIEGKVDRLLEKCRGKKQKLKEKELEREFKKMWRETLLEIPPISLEKRDIYAEVESYLRKNSYSHLKLYTQKLAGKRGLLSYRIHTFEIKNDHVQSSLWKRLFHFNSQIEYMHIIKDFANSLLCKCTSYIDEKLNSKGDYDETYCIDLLCMINETLQQPDVQNLHTTPGFEVDLKLHILGEAAHAFQRRHEEFVKENDPHMRLEKLKPHYFAIFRDLYQEKDAHHIQAKDFCEMCLHPAIVNYVNNRLGVEIVDNFHNSEQSIDFGSRSFFQFSILKDLLNEWDFDQYVEYITTYEKFVKSWILKKMVDYYTENEDLKNLEENIFSAILDRIRKTLNKLRHQGAETISEFVEDFSQEMQKELVIPKDSLVGTHMKQAFDPGHFFAFVESFLPNLQEQILSRFRDLDIESKLSELPVKPQDEIFKQMFGCGKQCPFCYTPCEAGGSAHQEHFATIHRPQGFGRFRYIDSEKLICSLCSTSVSTNQVFRNQDTNYEWHPYKEYRTYYPDWRIQPDPSIKASDYWKYIFKMFNDDFARQYNAKPADLPEDWGNITKEQALKALEDRYKL